jgi:tetratricopeptide (TPR) repeat protein
VKVWEAQTGQEGALLKEHRNKVFSVCFSPDGKRIASGSWDETVKVWEAQTGQEGALLKEHRNKVFSVCFSPDGKRLISSDANQKQIIWDLSTFKSLPTAEDQSLPGSPISPDGRWIALAEDNVIYVWPRLSAEERPQLRRLSLPDPAWHEEQARDSFTKGDWFGAAFHLGRLLQLHPWDAQGHLRLAQALTQCGRSDEAASHYRQAIGGRDWKEAAEKFRSTAHQPNAPVSAWYNLLLASRTAGQDSLCRQDCHALLDRFETTQDPAILEDVLLSSLVVPCDKADAFRLVKIGKGLVELNRSAARLHCLGVAQVRAGQYPEAARTFEEAIKVHGNGGYNETRLFLAMIQHRLGQHTAAQANLAGVEAWVKAENFDKWQKTTRYRLLLEEARALILTMPRAQ